MFTLQKETPLGRRGTLQTAHGTIETPFFMPVGTSGAMRGMTHDELDALGAQIMLCNTYHLFIRPGIDVIESSGGLHKFINWAKPILTDSGGYQVFSLRHMRNIEEDGVHFRSHLDGAPLFLGPEETTTIQHKLGADIIMCFDECPPSTASRYDIEVAVDRTLKWAKKCKEVHEQIAPTKAAPTKGCSLFGIIQGGLHFDLRKKCAEELIAIGFDGYAIGGLAVGESEDEMLDVVKEIAPLLPADKPRYLMGVGTVPQLQKCITLGIDMFDCVLPMRLGRHGKIILSDHSTISIHQERYKEDHSPIDLDSHSILSHKHSKSYLRHLLINEERYGETIATTQNLSVTLRAMQDLRENMDGMIPT